MAEDIIALGIEVETTGAKEGASALDALAKAGASAEKATDGLSSATKRTSSVMAGLASVAKTAAAAFGIYKIADYARDAALLNARYETLGVAMTVVGKNAGYTASQMEAAAVAMQKTGISMVESRQQAMRLVQAHIDLADSTKLARIAQDAAVIGGINSSEAFSRMIHGITTGQTEVLRGIGLNVSMEQSYKTMAQTLGKHTDALSQNEKMQAIVNAVMERGKDIAGSYEAAMDTAGKQMASMARYTEDLKVKLGEVFNESLTIAVMAWTAHLKDANGEIDKLAQNHELESWGNTFANILAGLADNADNLAGALKIVGISIGAAAAMAANAFNPAAISAIKESYNQDVDAILAKQDRFSKAVEERRAAIEEKKNKVVEAERKHQEDMTKIMLYYTDLRIKGMMSEQKYLETVTALNNQANDVHLDKDPTAPTKAPAASGLSDYQRLTKAIEEKIAVQGVEMALGEKATEGEKAYYKFLSDITGGYLNLTNAEKSRLATLHDRQLENEKEMESEKFLLRWKKSLAEEESAVHGAWMDDHRESLETTQKEIAAQEEHNLTVGMSKENLAALADARYADAIASKQRELAAISGTKADEDQKDMILSEIKALEKLRELKSKGTMLDAAADSAKKADEEWKKTAETIERSLTDSLMRGFESGKGFAENFRDTLVNMFKTLVLRPIIQGVVQVGMNAVGLGSAQGGGASGSIGSIASAGNSAYSLFSGGSSIAGYYQAAQAGAGLSASEAANAAAAYYNAGYYGTGASIEAGFALGGTAAGSTVMTAGGAASIGTGAELGFGTLVADGATVGSGVAAGGAANSGTLLGMGPAGWVALAAIAAYMIFSKDGGGPKTEGDYFGTLGADGTLTQSNTATGGSAFIDQNWYTAHGADAQMAALAPAIGASIFQTVKDLGGDATGMGINFGYNTDPMGDAPDNVAAALTDKDGNYVYKHVSDVDRDTSGTAMALEFQRMTLAAIGAADGIPKIFKDIVSGIDLTTATAEQMTQTLNDVQSAVALRDAFEDLNLDMDGLTVSLIKGAGGIAALATSLESYYQGYFSTQEQNDRLTASLTQSFTDLGLTMPTTRAGFRALVEGLDLTTTAGQNTFNALMGLQGSFGTIADAASAAATAASTAAANAAAEAQKQAAANATAANDAYFNAVQSAQDIAKSFNGILDSLRDYQQSLLLGDSSSLSSEARYAEAKNKYETTLSKAQHGDATAAGSLQSVADEFLAASQASSATATAYALDFGGVIAALEDLIKHKAVSNVDSIMRSTPGYVEAGMPLLTKHVSAFAAGGYHTGGLRLVGENGPELEVTGPSRIFNAGDTRNMLGGEALLEELRALRQEVAELRADQRAGQAQIASNTGKTAKLLDRVMPDGDAIQTRIAA